MQQKRVLMPGVEPPRSTPFVDAVWRIVLRAGFRLARVWWRITRPGHEGALVAVHVGPALLLVKSSYRDEWSFPGGGIEPGETPDFAAQRELEEEIGLASYPLRAAGTLSGIWDGRKDRVHFFELHLDRLPELRLDNREIVAAQLASPEALHDIALTEPVLAYLGQRSGS